MICDLIMTQNLVLFKTKYTNAKTGYTSANQLICNLMITQNLVLFKTTYTDVRTGYTSVKKRIAEGLHSDP